MKFFSNIAGFILIAVLFCRCSAVKQHHVPDNRFHKNDLTIAETPNFLADSTALTRFLLKHELQMRDLTDLAAEKNPEHTALLLFRSGQVVRLSKKGVPTMLINARGEGPGELLLPYTLKIRNGYLFLLDRNQSKISKYTPDGRFVKDILIKLGLTEDFEVLQNGNIVVVNPIPQRYEGKLLAVYNQKGTYAKGFGDNAILQPILKKTERIPSFKLEKSPEDQLIVTSVLRGKSFIYDMGGQKPVGHFSIQQGPEWEDIAQYEKNNANLGYVDKVKNVDSFPNGNIITSWGGPFKNTKSLCMVYSKSGVFLKRVLANKNLKNQPSLLSVEDDSTIWIFDNGAYILTRTHLVPYQH